VLRQMQQTSGSTNTATHKADVAYRYKVRGRDYSSGVITLADISSSAGRAQGIVRRYPDGAPVTVYYNPVDPSDALLERGGTGGIGVLLRPAPPGQAWGRHATGRSRHRAIGHAITRVRTEPESLAHLNGARGIVELSVSRLLHHRRHGHCLRVQTDRGPSV
jgi:hypothetical protein